MSWEEAKMQEHLEKLGARFEAVPDRGWRVTVPGLEGTIQPDGHGHWWHDDAKGRQVGNGQGVEELKRYLKDHGHER